jgi:hypothetical protein
VTTSPWLGKALLENVTSRRILGTSLLDKEILKDYMFRSNPPDGTSLQYLDGILISVWFAFIKRVVTLHFWCHCCGYGHMISLKLSANWGFGSCQESSTTTLRQGNVWKHGACFPSGQHLKKIKATSKIFQFHTHATWPRDPGQCVSFSLTLSSSDLNTASIWASSQS